MSSGLTSVNLHASQNLIFENIKKSNPSTRTITYRQGDKENCCRDTSPNLEVGHFTIKGETSNTSYPTIPSHHKIKLSDPDIYECKPDYPGQQDFY